DRVMELGLHFTEQSWSERVTLDEHEARRLGIEVPRREEPPPPPPVVVEPPKPVVLEPVRPEPPRSEVVRREPERPEPERREPERRGIFRSLLDLALGAPMEPRPTRSHRREPVEEAIEFEPPVRREPFTASAAPVGGSALREPASSYT